MTFNFEASVEDWEEVIKDTESAIELLEIEHSNYGTNIDRRLVKYDEKREEAKREIRRLKTEAARYMFEINENEEEIDDALGNFSMGECEPEDKGEECDGTADDIDSCSLLMSNWSLLDPGPEVMRIGKVADPAPEVVKLKVGKVVDPALEVTRIGKVVDPTPEEEKRKKENEKVVKAAEKRATTDIIGEAVANALKKEFEKEANEKRKKRVEEEKARVARNRRAVEAVARRGLVVVKNRA